MPAVSRYQGGIWKENFFMFGGFNSKEGQEVYGGSYKLDLGTDYSCISQEFETKTCTTLDVLAPLARSSACCCTIGSKLYIFAGRNPTQGLLSELWCFDMEVRKVRFL